MWRVFPLYMPPSRCFPPRRARASAPVFPGRQQRARTPGEKPGRRHFFCPRRHKPDARPDNVSVLIYTYTLPITHTHITHTRTPRCCVSTQQNRVRVSTSSPHTPVPPPLHTIHTYIYTCRRPVSPGARAFAAVLVDAQQRACAGGNRGGGFFLGAQDARNRMRPHVNISIYRYTHIQHTPRTFWHRRRNRTGCV